MAVLTCLTPLLLRHRPPTLTISHGCENDSHPPARRCAQRCADVGSRRGSADRETTALTRFTPRIRLTIISGVSVPATRRWLVAGLERRLPAGCNCQKVGGVCGHKQNDNPAEDPAGSMHACELPCASMLRFTPLDIIASSASFARRYRTRGGRSPGCGRRTKASPRSI